MSDTPHNESADLNDNGSKNEGDPPTPSEFLDWLRRWWDAPREKSKAADWVLVGLTVAIAIAAFWSAWVFQGQLEEAKRTTELTREAQRPWIKITDVELRKGYGPIKTLAFHWPLTGAEVPPMLQIEVRMLNVGHSVAQDVEVWPELFFGKFYSGKWHDVVAKEQQRFCKSEIDRTPSSAVSIVFPLDSTESYMGVGGVVHETDITYIPNNAGRYSAASLILCVNYRGAGTARYQTQALLGLYEDKQVLINIGVDVDDNHLKLERDQSGDHAN
jgi:hypothetical protein